MARLSASNIALPAYRHEMFLPRLAELGIEGLEVAPSRVWDTTAGRPSVAEVAAYRRAISDAGLAVVGVHSLLFGYKDLGLFRGRAAHESTVALIIALSALCRDLGGRTLIYGAGRRRGNVSRAEAQTETEAFLAAVLPHMERHGTIFCFEPLGPKDADFLNTVAECLSLIQAFTHPALGMHIDAKAMVENGEDTLSSFQAAQSRLVHYHANQPGLGRLDQGPVDHRKMGDFLRKIGYDGYVSIEQRMTDESDPLADVRRSVTVLKDCYA